MQKKLTITLDERIYEGLHAVIGRRRISRFIESLVRPHVLGQALDANYRQMAQDHEREAQALEWGDGTLVDSNPFQCCPKKAFDDAPAARRY